jgi:hypothetical protein
MMARAVVLLVKGRVNAYRYSLIALALGVIEGGIHMAVSRNLRGSSMPVDAVVYTAVLTLIILLLLRIPGIWEKVDFSKAKKSDSEKIGGAAAIVAGLLTLSIQHWIAPTHTINGINYGDAFNLSMTVVGWGLILAGLILVGWSNRKVRSHLHAWSEHPQAGS